MFLPCYGARIALAKKELATMMHKYLPEKMRSKYSSIRKVLIHSLVLKAIGNASLALSLNDLV